MKKITLSQNETFLKFSFFSLALVLVIVFFQSRILAATDASATPAEADKGSVAEAPKGKGDGAEGKSKKSTELKDEEIRNIYEGKDKHGETTTENFDELEEGGGGAESMKTGGLKESVASNNNKKKMIRALVRKKCKLDKKGKPLPGASELTPKEKKDCEQKTRDGEKAVAALNERNKHLGETIKSVEDSQGDMTQEGERRKVSLDHGHKNGDGDELVEGAKDDHRQAMDGSDDDELFGGDGDDTLKGGSGQLADGGSQEDSLPNLDEQRTKDVLADAQALHQATDKLAGEAANSADVDGRDEAKEKLMVMAFDLDNVELKVLDDLDQDTEFQARMQSELSAEPSYESMSEDDKAFFQLDYTSKELKKRVPLEIVKETGISEAAAKTFVTEFRKEHSRIEDMSIKREIDRLKETPAYLSETTQEGRSILEAQATNKKFFEDMDIVANPEIQEQIRRGEPLAEVKQAIDTHIGRSDKDYVDTINVFYGDRKDAYVVRTREEAEVLEIEMGKKDFVEQAKVAYADYFAVPLESATFEDADRAQAAYVASVDKMYGSGIGKEPITHATHAMHVVAASKGTPPPPRKIVLGGKVRYGHLLAAKKEKAVNGNSAYARVTTPTLKTALTAARVGRLNNNGIIYLPGGQRRQVDHVVYSRRAQVAINNGSIAGSPALGPAGVTPVKAKPTLGQRMRSGYGRFKDSFRDGAKRIFKDPTSGKKIFGDRGSVAQNKGRRGSSNNSFSGRNNRGGNSRGFRGGQGGNFSGIDFSDGNAGGSGAKRRAQRRTANVSSVDAGGFEDVRTDEDELSPLDSIRARIALLRAGLDQRIRAKEALPAPSSRMVHVARMASIAMMRGTRSVISMALPSRPAVENNVQDTEKPVAVAKNEEPKAEGEPAEEKAQKKDKKADAKADLSWLDEEIVEVTEFDRKMASAAQKRGIKVEKFRPTKNELVKKHAGPVEGYEERVTFTSLTGNSNWDKIRERHESLQMIMKK